MSESVNVEKSKLPETSDVYDARIQDAPQCIACNTYYGSSIISAFKSITEDGKEGYQFHGPHGGVSVWIPKEMFESVHEPFDNLSFGHAIEALKRGYVDKIRRKGWSEESSISILTDEYGFTALILTNDMHPDGIWLEYSDEVNFSMQDMLSDDWVVVLEKAEVKNE